MMANQDFYNGLSDEDKKLVQMPQTSRSRKSSYIDGLADEALEKIKAASDELPLRLNEEQIEAFRAGHLRLKTSSSR